MLMILTSFIEYLILFFIIQYSFNSVFLIVLIKKDIKNSSPPGKVHWVSTIASYYEREAIHVVIAAFQMQQHHS
jgi:hypothetical protein